MNSESIVKQIQERMDAALLGFQKELDRIVREMELGRGPAESADEPKLRVIAVACDNPKMFDDWLASLRLQWRTKYAGRMAVCGDLEFVRVSTGFDVCGCMFDGVVWLTRLSNDAENALWIRVRIAVEPSTAIRATLRK